MLRSYVDQTILPDEKILYRSHKHYIIFFQPVVWAIATIAVLLYPNPLMFWVATVFGLITLGSWVTAWLQYAVAEYVVTDQRVIMREGFFLKHINDTRLTSIANVEVLQGPLAQLLNYGIVVIKTAGGNDDPFIDISNPNEFKKQIQMQLNKRN